MRDVTLRIGLTVFLAVLIALLPVSAFSADPSPEAVKSAIDSLRERQARLVAAVEKSKSAFLFIKGLQSDGSRIGGISSGSGFCISADGYALTNDHVVAGSSRVEVLFTGGKRYEADIVGRDPMGDVALLKLKGAKDRPFLELGDSDSLRPGTHVFALGDPFLTGSDSILTAAAPPNFEPAVSAGVVSAVHRYSDTYNDAIQVDLAVNRGNSGGPLLTLDGKVVGINGKIETRFYLGINTGVGYAVPANQIQRFMKPLREAGGGIVLHGSIQGLQLGERANDKPGLPVIGVSSGTPAEESGFKVGDYIASLGGLPVRTYTRYLGVLGTYPAGEKISVKVVRGRDDVELKPTLVAPGKPWLGIRPRTSDDDDGVIVRDLEEWTPAYRGGMRAGDLIKKLDGVAIDSTSTLKAELTKHRPGDRVRFSVVRDDETLELEVMLGGKPE